MYIIKLVLEDGVDEVLEIELSNGDGVLELTSF